MDEKTRQEIIRGVCRSEGHGPLIDVSTYRDLTLGRRCLCNRGCGAEVWEIDRPATLAELAAKAGDRAGSATVRGTLEIWGAE